MLAKSSFRKLTVTDKRQLQFYKFNPSSFQIYQNYLIIIISMLFRSLTRTGLSFLKKTPLLRQPAFYFSQYNNNNQYSNANSNTNYMEEQLKTSHIVANNVGLSKFLNRTLMTAGLGFTGALTASYIAIAAGISPVVCTIGGIVSMLVGLLGAGKMAPIPANETYNGIPILKTANSPARLALYGLGLAGLGLSAAPLFSYAYFTSPHILPSAIGISAAIFGGASLVAYSMPKDKMLSTGRILGGSLLGLIGLQLVGLVSYLITGPNALTSLLFRADNYLGILLFSAFVAYDTHVAIKSYEMGYADHLGMSISFIMNIWNILMRVIYIMTGNRE